MEPFTIGLCVFAALSPTFGVAVYHFVFKGKIELEDIAEFFGVGEE